MCGYLSHNEYVLASFLTLQNNPVHAYIYIYIYISQRNKNYHNLYTKFSSLCVLWLKSCIPIEYWKKKKIVYLFFCNTRYFLRLVQIQYSGNTRIGGNLSFCLMLAKRKNLNGEWLASLISLVCGLWYLLVLH